MKELEFELDGGPPRKGHDECVEIGLGDGVEVGVLIDMIAIVFFDVLLQLLLVFFLHFFGGVQLVLVAKSFHL